MLDAHPQVAIAPEMQFMLPELMGRVLPRLRWRLSKIAPGPTMLLLELACLCRRLRTRQQMERIVLEQPVFDDFGLSRDAVRSCLRDVEPFDLASGLRALYGLYAAHHGKPRWGEKMPENLWFMWALQRTLPEVRFIHLIRDPRDVALSITRVWFGPNQISEVPRWWRMRMQLARLQAPWLRHYREVRYEDLVREPEATLRGLCDFLELEYDPALLRYHEHAAERLEEVGPRHVNGHIRIIDRRPLFENNLRPPDPALIGRWKDKLSADERRLFNRVCGKWLLEFGYELG
jgi:hypothetical protein